MPTNFIALLHIYIINDHMIYKSEFYKATFLWITLPFPCVNGISTIFITRGQFWPPGIVVACVCVCVCINHFFVRTITRHLFKLGSPNSVQRSKTPWLRSLLFWGAIDLDLQGQI